MSKVADIHRIEFFYSSSRFDEPIPVVTPTQRRGPCHR